MRQPCQEAGKPAHRKLALWDGDAGTRGGAV
jgi:hypothetical protein